jgi:hypothetical protein
MSAQIKTKDSKSVISSFYAKLIISKFNPLVQHP